MTENVYIIRVKTKPPLSSLYPSERRYSASTVGGLSLIHFGLGALSLLLGTLALSLQGPVLFVACLVPFVTGLLAWRRWYIDRNIAIFFYGSLFSLVMATLCFVVTIFDVAATSGAGRSLWPLEEVLDTAHPQHPPEEPANETRADDAAPLSKNNPFNVINDPGFRTIDEINVTSTNTEFDELDVHDAARNGGYDFGAEASFALEEKLATLSREILQDEDAANGTQRSSVDLKNEETLWRSRYENPSHAKVLLTLNVLVASLLEVFWSLLSAKIAFRGMMNRLPENSSAVASSKTTRPALQKRKPPAPRPDILDHDRRLSDTLQSFTGLQCLAGPRLPLPESSREFRERVERFLANQATHRTVESV
ncbi:uncharacterized protein LOC109503605 [Harpegnathos saltator]|uniref:Uncharacterized protein n=1 Tax=Harpegnathos saltator TaxID=610380 RepID=E2B9P6_HARSA|nr:uncharacterized protein LOC109503605 [Harpegnathos saltator]XP_019695716.1 uncharacterized protein LOC109503605 [Harpegnathos saltator]XP_019695717.1 uncharacterized protein LOC109503605 [Harpegnathos saltator]XP_025154057.1 uncharacterized protein LOC109503605 [Harpegnathos saltator]XP_025154058.1 uncharacterized protein LOC109503605 [Harpegnathos saltator]EFN87580.1 hypothetical protein EAI_07196 [Harpegnathos saltator]